MARCVMITVLACVAAFSYMRAPWAADKTGTAGVTEHTRGLRSAQAQGLRQGRPSPYWLLERRYWALERQAGALGREVRRLRRVAAERQLEARTGTVATIRLVFGAHGDEAVRVVACETGDTFSTTARNGQYLGLFQMGDYARGAYGHGDTVLEQALAAYRYFLASGSNWGPWSCKP